MRQLSYIVMTKLCSLPLTTFAVVVRVDLEKRHRNPINTERNNVVTLD